MAIAMTQVYWFEQSEADVPQTDEWLGANELARLNRLRVPKRRAEWRLGRWTAKQAVAAYSNMPADPETLARIEIRQAKSGAPEVFLSNQPAGLTISLGHRAGKAACAIAGPDAVLGCDLEIVEPRSDAFVADYLSTCEQELVAAATGADRDRVVTLLWSAKESALKALREGLRLDTRSVIASPVEVWSQNHGPNQWRPLQVRHGEGTMFYGWWQAADGFLRTLVAATAPPPPTKLKVAPGGPEEKAA
jgi:4'-phosphopantetheinyl transferase